MTDDNTYTIELPVGRVGLCPNYPNKYKSELTEEEVRKLASQLPEKDGLFFRKKMYDFIEEKTQKRPVSKDYKDAVKDFADWLDKNTLVPEETEQQKVSYCSVSECCGQAIETDGNLAFCKSCGEPCDAVEPEDKIEKLPKWTLIDPNDDAVKDIDKSNIIYWLKKHNRKINEIIEKINNEQ